ncbi:MAG TPA: hypothetical protein VH369_05595 [Bryobacteraceae bacterium]
MRSYFAPLRARSAEPLALDMQSLFLSGRVVPFGAKLSITHVFRSSEKSPVEVVYCFPPSTRRFSSQLSNFRRKLFDRQPS